LSGDEAYDAYLNFDNLENLMEDYYKILNGTSTGTAVFDTSQYTSGFWASPQGLQAYKAPSEVAKHEIKKNMAFVLMAMDPDNAELEDIYHAIKDVCVSFDIEAYRADEIEHQDRITDRILYEIKTCEFLIADVTHERPNVYYEIGYAHAINKRPILYRKKGTKLHFDLSVHNIPEYRNATELRDMLTKRLEAILGRTAS